MHTILKENRHHVQFFKIILIETYLRSTDSQDTDIHNTGSDYICYVTKDVIK